MNLFQANLFPQNANIGRERTKSVLEAHIEDLLKDIESCRNENDALRSVVSGLRSKKEALNSGKHDLVNKIQILNQESLTAYENVANLQRKQDKLQHEMDSLNAKTKRLGSKNDKLKNSWNSLNAKTQRLAPK